MDAFLAVRTVLAAIIVALGVVVVSQASEFDPLEEVYSAPRSTVVPPTAAPPKIDGLIGEREWDVASAQTGLYSYNDQFLLSDSPVLFTCYDQDALYLLCLVPEDQGKPPLAKVTERDGAVFRDDSVEIYLQPVSKDVYQIVANSLGTVADFKNSNVDWNGDYLILPGRVKGESLPGWWKIAGRNYWFIEARIPFADLGTPPLKPGEKWGFNLAVNRGGPWAVLAPVKGKLFADTSMFSEMVFLGSSDPYAQITSFGNVQFGEMEIAGRLVNPGEQPVKIGVDTDLRKEGSYLTHDAYRNVVGAISSVSRTVTVAAGSSEPIQVSNAVADTSINLVAVRIASLGAADKVKSALFTTHGPAKIEPPLILKVGNVPSGSYAVLQVDSSGLAGRVGNGTVAYRVEVADSEGRVGLIKEANAEVGATEIRVDYSGFAVGNYTCRVSAYSGGEKLAESEGVFNRLEKPVWLASTIYDDYGKMDRVPLPWQPVAARGQSISVWGRTISWNKGSILPSSITTQGVELLRAPMRLIATIDGADYFVPLDSFKIIERKAMRVSAKATGAVRGLSVAADLWVEYDGLLWLELRTQDTIKGRKVSALRVITEMDAARTPLYQSHNNAMTGYIGKKPIKFAWLPNANENIVNFYHWFGNEDTGLGFTYTTLEHWAPKTDENFATLHPGRRVHTYTINLIENPASVQDRTFMFGVQATPIKPLPPDYHSMMAGSIEYRPWKANLQIPENFDIWLSWPEPMTRIMLGLNNPYNVDEKLMSDVVKFSHDHGVAITTVASCPQKVSPNEKHFKDYITEWKVLPESVLNWNGTQQVQNCGRSYTLRKWLFYGWAIENVKKFGTEGIYFDGWQSGSIACANPHHGCGWVDEQGKRHVVVPILEGREFNHRMCLWLEDNVKSPYYSAKTAPERPGFPKYHYWIHSWCFAPSVMGFATEWLTGEFTGYPLKGPSMLTPEGTYGKCSGLGEFRTRALSTNWGVPNLFDALMWENLEDSPNKQTLNAFAWFLPHGVSIGLTGYMNQKTLVEIARLMMSFETRKSEFIPAWRPNPHVKIISPVAPEVMAATWEHPTKSKVLVVVSNLKVEEKHEVVVEWTGFPKASLKNARTGEPITLTNGRFSVNLEPESFILIEASRTE